MQERFAGLGEKTNNLYLSYLQDGGEMGRLTRQYNWAATSLGHPDQWPQSLLTTLGIILHSKFPMFLFWGPEHICFYNDAYRPSLGNNAKHPYALGKKGEEIWPEIWPDIKPLIDRVLADMDATWSEDQLLPIYRNNRMEDVYWTFSYSPVIGETGTSAGVFVTCTETTKKVESLNMLSISEQRFRNLVSEATVATAVFTGQEMVLELANDAALEIWGKDKSVIGKPILEFLPELAGQHFPAVLYKVLTTGEVHRDYDAPVSLKKQGMPETLYMDISFKPLRGEHDTIRSVLVMGTDVTETVIAKRQLEKSEKNLRNMITQSPVAMCIFRGSGHIVEIANERMLELWGKAGSQILNKPIFEGLPEAKGQGFEELLQDVYTTGETYTAYGLPVMLPRNGKIETVYLNFVYEAFRETDGTISGIMAVATEVTEQVLARRTLQEAEEKTRLAIKSADLGVYETVLDTNEITTDTRFNEIWGFTQPASRQEYAAAIHPDDLLIREQAHTASLISGQLNFEARIIRKDKSIHWIRIRGKVIYNDKGAAAKILGVVQDITEQKLFSEALERKVIERTKELAEANLQLQQSNVELNQFAYIASHDLQEPLRKVRTFTGLMELTLGNIPQDAKIYIKKIQDSTERMQALINDVLKFSLLSKEREQFQDVDLNNVLKNILSDYDLLIEQKEATIKADELPVIEAIPVQMGQLFTNILSNALKFASKKRQLEISILSRQLPKHEVQQHNELNEDKLHYLIEFKDNGIGFNQDYSQRIFTMFQRLHGKMAYEGTGIGLAMCRKITINHHGVIYAISNPDEGASFIVILPEKQN